MDARAWVQVTGRCEERSPQTHVLTDAEKLNGQRGRNWGSPAMAFPPGRDVLSLG